MEKVVKMSELKVGDVIIADYGGFDCIVQGARLIVQKDEKGHLFVNCDEGDHYLCSQLSTRDNDTLIGFSHAQV